MVVEEEWLMETGGRMMEDRSAHCCMEREESVVEVERQPVYPHHHGRVHTLMPGPVTITEKGVDGAR